MASLRQRNVLVSLPYRGNVLVLHRWVAQVISLRQAIMFVYNNKKS